MTEPLGEYCTKAPGCPHPPGHDSRCESPLSGLDPVDAANLRGLLGAQSPPSGSGVPSVPEGGSTDETLSFDEAVDRDWARAGEDLAYGTDLIVEWGVQYSRPYGSRVSLYGVDENAERQAREFAASAEPGWDLKVTVVSRRVLVGPWGERNG